MGDLRTLSTYGTEPHPYLNEPVLYISGLPSHVTDDQITSALSGCLPIRPNINRRCPDEELRGTIEFEDLYRGHSHPIHFRIN